MKHGAPGRDQSVASVPIDDTTHGEGRCWKAGVNVLQLLPLMAQLTGKACETLDWGSKCYGCFHLRHSSRGGLVEREAPSGGQGATTVPTHGTAHGEDQ